MAARARFAADLLAGRIPDDVEAAFSGHRAARSSPRTPTRSSCRARATRRFPCVARGRRSPCSSATRLADDAFLVFLLRGVPREELLEGLQRARTRPERGPRPRRPRTGPASLAARTEPPEPLPAAVLERPELFYRPGEPAAALRAVLAPPEHPEAVLTRLGPPPFKDPEAARLLIELHRAIGLGARERLADWEWRRAGGRG